MITTAAIAWAIIATVGSVIVWLDARSQVRELDRQGYGQYVRAEKLAREMAAHKAKDRAHMREIGAKGNASQKAAREAKVRETTARLETGR